MADNRSYVNYIHLHTRTKPNYPYTRAAGVWNRNPPYIQATSGNTVSVFVPPASAALVRVLQ
jgi:hypothetical protein